MVVMVGWQPNERASPRRADPQRAAGEVRVDAAFVGQDSLAENAP